MPLWTLANLYEDQENWQVARILYERALELEPDDATANMNFGRMLMKAGEPAAAKVYLGRGLLLNPSDEQANSWANSRDSLPTDNRG